MLDIQISVNFCIINSNFSCLFGSAINIHTGSLFIGEFSVHRTFALTSLSV
jgi:hypothetical protein